MAPSNTNLRQKGSKLQVFATTEPLEDDYQTAPIRFDDAPEEVPPPVPPQAPRHESAPVQPPAQLSRQELADSFRLPTSRPAAGKVHTNGHQRDRSAAGQQGSPAKRHASPRPAQPPVQPRPLSRAESSVNGLFAGSNLGEDFMRSTMTSPSVELEENHARPVEVQRAEAVTKTEKPKPRHWARQVPMQTFGADDHGFLQVFQKDVKIGASQYNDGFAKDAQPVRRSGFDGFEEPAEEMEGWGRRQQQPPAALRGERRKIVKSKDDKVIRVRRVSPEKAQSPPKQAQARQRSPVQVQDKRRSHHYSQPIENHKDQDIFAQSSAPYRHSQPALELQQDLTEDSGGQSSEEDVKQVTPKASRSKGVRIHDEANEDQTVKQLFVNEPPRMNKRSRGTGDYPDDALTNMNFSDLKAQPFDFDPSSAPTANAPTNDQPQDLPTKLTKHQQSSEDEQRQFFASMPIEEWEEAGDWFLGQFGALMQKMRDARREKRRVIGEFEEEAERREEEVRRRSEGLERKLGRMRQDGMKVIGDGQ